MQTQKRVLILEDDPQWQTIVSQLLKKADRNLEIRCVPTTNQAIDLLASGMTYDLIVADQFLDGALTGLDFYHHLQQTKSKSKFVLLSSIANHEFHELVESDVETPLFVSKSESLSGLFAVVKAEMRESAVLPVVDTVAMKEKAEAYLALLLAVSAAAFLLSQPHFSFSPGLQEMPVSPVTFEPTAKNQILMRHGHSKVTKLAAHEAVSPQKPGHASLIPSQVRDQIQQIAHRADQIGKSVR